MSLSEPLELLRQTIESNIVIKCRSGIELTGRLLGYDPHMNLLLADCTETKEVDGKVAIFETRSKMVADSV